MIPLRKYTPLTWRLIEAEGSRLLRGMKTTKITKRAVIEIVVLLSNLLQMPAAKKVSMITSFACIKFVRLGDTKLTEVGTWNKKY
ncbi:hypothetical protein AOX59_13340 [Lentibacillus amyloliquefaciens]|uniref:Uncharacterized protein n=1 Tax=Lentibacillus amyloliquefaciens TaxID=1472767 RepID=A0A0U4DVR1_9BACI|nr:hypothetical protein AOX59_13340 [Lentibacillus amyloliquefaciens]